LEQTVFGVAPTMVHVVREITGVQFDGEAMRDRILEGVREGLFHNYGEAIFINPHRVDPLMAKFGIAAGLRDTFLAEARKHYLVYDQFYAGQMPAIYASHPRGESRGQNYIERMYTVPTRDGVPITFTRIVNVDRVVTNDDRPSVVLVTCLAGERATFDLSDSDSPALDLADRANWVYIFEPRGSGRNRGEFDPNAFLDTFVSNDLPAVLGFVHNRPKIKKPAVLVGHSRGGDVAKFMIVRAAFKLNQAVDAIGKVTGQGFTTRGKTRTEIAQYLDEIDRDRAGQERSPELDSRLEEARINLELLRGVKALITLGSPMIFDKNYHEIFPLLLMLNHLLPFVGADRVPVEWAKWLAATIPGLIKIVRMLINPRNFDDPDGFLKAFVGRGTTDFSMGEGFQFLKAVYGGRGFKRMGKDQFNYPEHLDLIPPDLPVIDFVGEDDILCAPYNLGFINRAFASPRLDFSHFPQYAHSRRNVARIRLSDDADSIPLPSGSSYVQGYLVEGIGHLDYLFGRRGQVIRRFVERLVERVGTP